MIRASVAVAATVSFLAFATKTQLSRCTVGTALLGAPLLILLRPVRGPVGAARASAGGPARPAHRMVLVGTLPEALEVYTAVTRSPAAGLVPVAIHITDGYAAARGMQTPVPVYAGRDVLALVREVGGDTIAVCGSASAEPGELRRLAWQLEGSGVDLVVAPQLTDIAGPRVHIRPIEGLPLLHVEEPTLSGPALLAKNLMDRVAAGLGLLLLIPLFLAIADRDPDLRPRAGLLPPAPGRPRGAHLPGVEVPHHVRRRRGPAGQPGRPERDRRHAVQDEAGPAGLPGGPLPARLLAGRAAAADQRALGRDVAGRARARCPPTTATSSATCAAGCWSGPGMTGLWQVSGRSDLSWDEAVRLDLYYVDNWSLAYDLSILWRTVGVVLARKGAY